MRTLFKPFICGISPAFILFFCIAAWLFHSNPQWDINFSAIFYINSDFYASDKWWGDFVYSGVHFATPVVIALYAIYLLLSFILKKKRFIGISRKAILYMALVLILGPGLFVNSVLKEHIGRARPVDTQCFSGEQQFAPAFARTNECDGNCSFVSGHASFGFYWLALGFLGTTVFRKRMGYALGIFMGFGIGLVRIMQGKHFLSDIVFAGFFVYLTAAVVYWLLYIKFAEYTDTATNA